MAKMKIYEIARSIQQQDKNIKSGDLVTLLNENGFEVKGANSNIEDEAIGFLMNYFKKKKATAKKPLPSRQKRYRPAFLPNLIRNKWTRCLNCWSSRK